MNERKLQNKQKKLRNKGNYVSAEERMKDKMF